MTSHSRVDVQLFVRDLLGQRDPITYERHPNTEDRGSLRLDDGEGLKVAISGDRSSLRVLVAGALEQLGPEVVPTERHDEPPTNPEDR